MIRLMSIRSLTVLAGYGVITQTEAIPDSIAKWIIQCGALGLCGFMVFQNYHQMAAMRKELAEKNKEVMNALKDNSASFRRIAAALETRPCLKGDRIFEPRNQDLE